MRLQASFVGIKCETEMANWEDKPHVLLGDLVGCTEQCPFCKEQCDLIQPNSTQSRSTSTFLSCRTANKVLCYPVEIGGTGQFLSPIDNKYHPYKDYQYFYPNW